MYKKIMIPLDGSELAECVLPHVENFVKGFPESNIVFIRVVEPITLATHGETYTRKEINLEEQESERKSNAQEYLTNVIQGIKAEGAKFASEVIVGRVSDSLADFAEKNDVDLVLIATHGRSGVSRWVRGSVADKVLRSSHVPVLMVRAPGTRGGI
jgi:nucleotide-binding universal stress UspA family protein